MTHSSSKSRNGVFISYARDGGEAFAKRLSQKLEKEEINLWRDREGMKGGHDWWLQITSALDQVRFMALVMTPKSLESDIVRKEWLYARQQGVVVYPIKGSPDIVFSKLPRWMRDLHFYDLGSIENDLNGPEWKTFVNDLNKTPGVRRVPFMVEDLVGDFVDRPAKFNRLLGLLLDEKREEPVAITAALRGAGGYGKTTLARALCHNPQIQDAFDDGVLWVTLGENPGDLTIHVENLIRMLSGENSGLTGLEAATTRLKELLADRDILMVIDDVWNEAHLRPFLQGGSRCARLITSRNPQTLPDRAVEVKVDSMKKSEAVRLLGAGLKVEEVERELRALAERLHKWPLLLKLSNGVLRSQTKSGRLLSDAIVYANRAYDKRGLVAFDERDPVKRNQAAEKTLRVSLDQLKAEDSDVRWRAAEALGSLGGERAIGALIEALKDKDSDVRKSAAVALGSLGEERTTGALIEALNDKDSDVRKSAVVALGSLGGERAIRALIEALKDEDSDVRWRAAAALGCLGGEKAIEGLIEALKDKDSDVRKSAAVALGSLGREKAIEGLIEALKDKDSDVRKSGCLGIVEEKCNAKEAEKALLAYTSLGSPSLRPDVGCILRA